MPFPKHIKPSWSRNVQNAFPENGVLWLRAEPFFFWTIRSEMASPGLDEDRVEGLLTHLAESRSAKRSAE